MTLLAPSFFIHSTNGLGFKKFSGQCMKGLGKDRDRFNLYIGTPDAFELLDIAHGDPEFFGKVFLGKSFSFS